MTAAAMRKRAGEVPSAIFVALRNEGVSCDLCSCAGVVYERRIVGSPNGAGDFVALCEECVEGLGVAARNRRRRELGR